MYLLKAKFFTLAIGLIWLSLIILMLPLMLTSAIADGGFKRGGWLHSILLAQDHLTSVICGEHYLTTISSLLGYLRKVGSRTGGAMADFVDMLFKVFSGQDNHCDIAMESSDIYLFSVKRALTGSITYLVTLYYIFI